MLLRPSSSRRVGIGSPRILHRGRTRSLTGDTYDRLAERAGLPTSWICSAKPPGGPIPLVGYVWRWRRGPLRPESDPSSERVDEAGHRPMQMSTPLRES